MKKVLVVLFCVSFSTSFLFAESGKLDNKTANKKDYQVPNALEEPEIITIEATPEKEEPLKEELVIVDLPPLVDNTNSQDKKTAAIPETKTLEENKETVTDSENSKEYVENNNKDTITPDDAVSDKSDNHESGTKESLKEEEENPEDKGKNSTTDEIKNENESSTEILENKNDNVAGNNEPEKDNTAAPEDSVLDNKTIETNKSELPEKEVIKEEPQKETVIEEEVVIEEEITEELQVNKIRPSRSVTLNRREYVDITYPGTGWIYSGIIDGSRDLLYFGRALGTKNTTFTFQARYPGTKVLHFYKNDYLTGEYIDDYVKIVILPEESKNKSHVSAPPYQQVMPNNTDIAEIELPVIEEEDNFEDEVVALIDEEEKEKEITSKAKQAAGIKEVTLPVNNINKTNIKDTKLHEPETPEILLEEANLLYNDKDFENALKMVNSFLENASKDIDKGLFLKGRILESDSNIQDIKNAIITYTKLIKEYPASKLWNDANKRIIYLKRFYLEAR